ncbi:MAG: Hpt domain-containing protein [Chromatiaceae bacterium]|nr:MAG: Hpt domain-containing protein [Chromatiaceae bacterium]
MSAAESAPASCPPHPADSRADPPGALPMIDVPAALEAVGGDAALMQELLRELQAELPTELAELQRLASAGDLPNLAEQAHKARGGASYCGVSALIAALGALERGARRGDTAAVGQALPRVATEIERLQQYLQQPAQVQSQNRG